MCGICGIVSLRDAGVSFADFSSTRLRSMLEKLSHRGPQGSGLSTPDNAALGVQRLAIRGLSDGRQPVTDADSGVVALCNGEIDNHDDLRAWLARRGRAVKHVTDVSVLPGLYLETGEKFIERLKGVFAVAIWDPRKRKLLLARDRAGERLLFYNRNRHTVSFATEIASLVAGLSHRPELDREAIAGYLFRGYFIAPGTPLRDVKKVRPGEVITFSAGQTRQRRYWHWPILEAPKSTPSISGFDHIFHEAVRTQSKIDVDYGFFMSGGIDSSLIVAVASSIRSEKKPPCYTLRFSESSYDEGAFAERAAGLPGLDMVSVWVKPEMFPSELRRLVSMTGEPLADPAWIPTALLSRRAAQDVRLVFSGEGGDELFGGYPTYLGAILALHYDRLPAPFRRIIRATVDALPPSERKVPLSFLLKKFVKDEGMDPFSRHLLWTATVSPGLMKKLGVVPVIPDAPPEGPILDRLQLYDLETSLSEGLLAKTDRGGMSASLEIRCPFLDDSVMDFAATLPRRARVDGITTKAFLKHYALRYLPRDIVHRRKRGLSVPLAAWLRGPLRNWAEKKLESGRLDEVGVYTEDVMSLTKEHMTRRADHARPLWALLVLDEWLAWNASRQDGNGAAGRSKI